MLVTAMRRKWHSVCDKLSNLPGTWCAFNKYEFGARLDESNPRVRYSRWVQSRLTAGCLSAVLRLQGFPPGSVSSGRLLGNFTLLSWTLRQFLRKLLVICGILLVLEEAILWVERGLGNCVNSPDVLTSALCVLKPVSLKLTLFSGALVLKWELWFPLGSERDLCCHLQMENILDLFLEEPV